MAKRPPTDYDALLKELRELNQPKPDPSKGKTMLEWAEIFKFERSQMARHINRGVRAGLWVRDKDFRLDADGVARTRPVYRRKVK